MYTDDIIILSATETEDNTQSIWCRWCLAHDAIDYADYESEYNVVATRTVTQ